jgi:hypothetical protein
MGEHSLPDDTTPTVDTRTPRPEPVAIAAAVQAVLAAIVTIGWVQLDDATIATIATVIAGAVSVILTLYTRSKVTPVPGQKLKE